MTDDEECFDTMNAKYVCNFKLTLPPHKEAIICMTEVARQDVEAKLIDAGYLLMDNKTKEGNIIRRYVDPLLLSPLHEDEKENDN